MKKCPYCDGEIKDNVIKCVNCHKVLPGKQYTSKYRKLVQTVPDVMYELDTDGNFLFVSEAIKIFGYNPEDLIGKHFREMVHPDDFKKVDRMFILPKFKGKTTGDDKAPKLFDERRTKKRMTINMEVRILAKGEQAEKRDYFYVEVHSSGMWNRPVMYENKKFVGVVGIFRDVTHRKFFEYSLKEKEKDLLNLINNNPDGIIVVSKTNEVLFVNPLAEKLFKRKAEDFVGRSFDVSLADQDSMELEIVHENNEKIIIEMLIMEAVWEGEESYIVSLRDETENIRTRETFREQSMTDDLTGLYNRRAFIMLGEHQLKVSKRNKEEMCMLFIDVDNLKGINDKYGHLEGDKVLIEVANSIKASFRESDITSRIGGDEFAVMTISAKKEDMNVLVNRLQSYIELVSTKDTPYQISISVGGMCEIPGEGIKIEDLIKKADTKMYDEKQQKKREK